MTRDRYTATAIALHWLVAALVLAAVTIGTYAVGLEVSPRKLKLYSWHKWIGVTIFLLALLRVGWRWTHAAPPLPPGMAHWERRLAAATHGLLYLLLFAVPLSGWLMSSASGFPVVYFGLLPLPDLVTKDKALADALKLTHDLLNDALILLVGLHVAAALKHHLHDRDTVLIRMLPGLKPRIPRKET
jgi:cytochrome b561